MNKNYKFTAMSSGCGAVVLSNDESIFENFESVLKALDSINNGEPAHWVWDETTKTYICHTFRQVANTGGNLIKCETTIERNHEHDQN
jgi:hypothetical protein